MHTSMLMLSNEKIELTKTAYELLGGHIELLDEELGKFESEITLNTAQQELEQLHQQQADALAQRFVFTKIKSLSLLFHVCVRACFHKDKQKYLLKLLPTGKKVQRRSVLRCTVATTTTLAKGIKSLRGSLQLDRQTSGF